MWPLITVNCSMTCLPDENWTVLFTVLLQNPVEEITVAVYVRSQSSFTTQEVVLDVQEMEPPSLLTSVVV